MTTMSSLGKFTPGFAFVISGSFHFVIVPRINSRKGFLRELQRDVHTGNVVARDTSAPITVGKCRILNPACCKLLVAHRSIRSAEVYGFGGYLPNAAARADCLIIDFDIWMSLVIFVKPLGIDRCGESCARGIDLNGLSCPDSSQTETQHRTETHGQHSPFHDVWFLLARIVCDECYARVTRWRIRGERAAMALLPEQPPNLSAKFT